MRQFILLAAACALAGCSEQDKSKDERWVASPRDAEAATGATDDFLPSNPSMMDLFAPYIRPTGKNGSPLVDGTIDLASQHQTLYLCPEMKDVEKFLESLWDRYRSDINAQQKLPPQEQTAPVEGMDGLIAKAGCKQHQAIVLAEKLLAWRALGNKNYKNDDRWIAFRQDGQKKGFYLTLAPSVD